MSKSLEALEKIGECDLHSEREDYCFLKNVYTNEYKIIEKELKALEIIKNKPQAEISLIAWGKIKTYEEYLKKVGEWDEGYGDLILTQEEYDLLKEVLL